MKHRLLLAFVFTFFNFEIAYSIETKYFTQSNPKGWIQQPGSEANYIFLASVISKEKLPILISMTLDKELSPTQVSSFLKQTIRSGFSKAKKLKFKDSKLPQLSFPYSFVEISYLEEAVPYKGYAMIIPHNEIYHYFQFTTAEVNFSVYSKDVLEVFRSTKLK